MKKTYWQRAYGKYKNIRHYVVAHKNVYKYGNPGKKIFAIGVTGTDGKTTTSALIYHILNVANKKVALIDTLGAYMDNKRLNTGLHVTSPDSGFIQSFLKKLVQKKYEYVVLESTSHGLDQHRLLGVDFKIGVLTNLTHEHLDYHETMQNYARAKAKLFRTVDTAIINTKAVEKIDFKKLIYRSNMHLIDFDSTFLTHYPDISKSIIKRFPQKYNQLNAIASVETALSLGISNKKIIQAIMTFPNIDGRLELIKNKMGVNAYVDFAHTPHALDELLVYLNGIKKTGQKLVVLFGCAGDRDKEKRPIMGQIASRYANIIILTSEDPRLEDPNKIIQSIKRGIVKEESFHGKVIVETDRKKAIQLAIKNSKKGDILVLCGKGHEASMNIGGVEYPWSDKNELVRALSKN